MTSILGYDTIVIGSTLEAAAYAYMHKLPLLYVEKGEPLGHKFIEQDFYDCYYRSTDDVNLREIKNHFLFLLSLGGSLPLSDSIRSIRLIDTKKIKVSKINFEKIFINFKKLILFEPVLLGGLDILERKKLKNLVIDRIQIKNAAKNPFKYIWDKEDFVKEIYFYQKSQAAAFSYLTDKESLDHDYSEFFLKRKILWMMDQNGIECSKQKATIKIEPRERTIRQRFKETYNLPDFISINKQKLEEICSPTNQKTSKKLWELFPPTTQKEVSECLGMTRLYLYIKDIPL